MKSTWLQYFEPGFLLAATIGIVNAKALMLAEVTVKLEGGCWAL